MDFELSEAQLAFQDMARSFATEQLAPHAGDWDENCDQASTNGDVFLRSADWYRRRLRRHFVPVGGGLFVKRDAPIVLWELEKLA